jgi:hypothetical protein
VQEPLVRVVLDLDKIQPRFLGGPGSPQRELRRLGERHDAHAELRLSGLRCHSPTPLVDRVCGRIRTIWSHPGPLDRERPPCRLDRLESPLYRCSPLFQERREREPLAEALRVLIHGEVEAFDGDLEEHAARLAEVDRAEVVPVQNRRHVVV